MRAFIFIVLASMSQAVFSQAKYKQEIPDEYGYAVTVNQTVPNFDLVMPDGTKTNIKELRGKVVMIQFTASWCGVCRKEMPHIEKDIWQRWKDNKNFALYGIDLKESKEKTIEFQKQIGVTYPIALDLDGSIFEKFTVPNAGVTRNIIIDKEGRIAYMTRLFKQEEFDEMIEVISLLISSSKEE